MSLTLPFFCELNISFALKAQVQVPFCLAMPRKDYASALQILNASSAVFVYKNLSNYSMVISGLCYYYLQKFHGDMIYVKTRRNGLAQIEKAVFGS